jgi:hypothetical protein
MDKAPKTARQKKPPKAARPELHPLDERLAALLNPALNERQLGVSEAAQAEYVPPRPMPLRRLPGMSGVGCRL